MPLGEVIVGAALGLVIQILHQAIQRAKDRSTTTRFILGRLDDTVYRITPLIVKVEKLSEEADESLRRVTEDLKRLLQQAVVLVEAYAELKRRNLLKKFSYNRRIKELEASLRWMVDVDVQVNQWLDIQELMAKMSVMNTKLDEITFQQTDHVTSVKNDNKQNIVVEAEDQYSETKDDGCSNEVSKPKIDIHLQWKRKKHDKNREFRFVLN
ncbi:unnamed protein product [Thlaspi arvense]|uniref:RPW8 domain-containing protein n=1 Tax=Thlaspi arvense TaxID=13288 RepID=A0AAU9SBJ4_THLAR|nr:unnamed protein product [Thlaspi arvense]